MCRDIWLDFPHMPTRYRPGEVAELLGVSVDTVRRWADSGRLKTRRSSGGRRTVDGAELARFLERTETSADVPVVVSESARNRFPGIVTRVVKDKVTAQVEIRTGRHRIVSLMTREAADELGLAPGVMAVAAVKATNVVVELPAS
jgi:molybdopterin-binding protein